MAAGNPVIAHDNLFNRWVAGESARYFNGADECADRLDEVLQNPDMISEMKADMLQQHQELFIWEKVLVDYETLLSDQSFN